MKLFISRFAGGWCPLSRKRQVGNIRERRSDSIALTTVFLLVFDEQFEIFCQIALKNSQDADIQGLKFFVICEGGLKTRRKQLMFIRHYYDISRRPTDSSIKEQPYRLGPSITSLENHRHPSSRVL